LLLINDLNENFTGILQLALNVYLHNLTNEGADQLAKEICEKLNQTETLFPGTNLKIIYNLVSDKNHRGQVF